MTGDYGTVFQGKKRNKIIVEHYKIRYYDL